ncbi:MAG: DUF4915 domain-containing protein [Candidatus Cloacimonetes bacterium]|nr:DUF4915 domain-containing protein [Candidatus Cloacimonadota bacterium]
MKKTFKELVKLGSIYSLGNVMQKGASFFLIPIYTAYLGTYEYGIIALMGAVSENQIFYPDEAFSAICKKSTDSSSLNKYIRRLVGMCYIVLESNEQINLFSTPSATGLFYAKADDRIILSEDESLIYKYADLDKFNEIELLNSLISHQGLIRMPFSTPFGNIKRIIGGCSISIDRLLSTSFDLYLMKSSKELVSANNSDFTADYEEFVFLLEGTLKLITAYYDNNDMFLAKSGGIDSSVLLAALSKINAKFSPVYFPYSGIGSKAEKTERILTGKKITAIVDNASNLWDEIQLGVKVNSPDFLKTNKGKKSFVIICTTSFAEVSKQLEEMGFIPNEDFIVSPILNDLRIIDELENIKQRLIFTSGSPKQESDKYGGGVYELEVNGDTWHHRKVISGNCYGLTRCGDNFVTVDTEIGIFEFNEDYEIIRSQELPQGTRAHGIDYSESTGSFYVVGSYLDAVLVLDKDFNIKDKISISHKFERYGKPFHHCNDCCVLSDSLYVSMFSRTGNWKLDVFDGVVLEIDIKTKKIIGPVIKDLWMPHNIELIGGILNILDSLPGHLKTNNAQIIGDFPAFTRGLAHNGIYYFIGQSRNRNYSKNLGISKNISIDAGIIIFDEYTKVSRFLQLPPKLSEIHSILLI